MPLLSLSFNNFRNLENKTIDLLSKEVYFVGKNGQGKTNILEAIYMSSYGNSFKTHVDSEIVKFNETNFFIKSFFREINGNSHTINTYYDSAKNIKKIIEKNGKKIKDKKEIINTIPCILFCHEDLDFVIGEPERKRFFLDQSLAMYDIIYIDILRKYKKILKNRNILLKEKKYDTLDIFDIQLAEVGKEIIIKRKNAIYQFNRIFGNLFEKITGISGVFIHYSPSWKCTDINEIIKILKEKREIDKVMCTTMSGPHRDKIRFMKDNKQYVSSASTGQKRLLSIILRIAQAQFFSEITNKKPILLMDDVLLELDTDKRQKVITFLPEYDQLFCTFLPEEPYEKYKKTTTKIYYIENGSWNE